MRVIFFACVVATALGTAYTNSGDYVKLQWHGTTAVADVDAVADTCTSVAVASTNLLRIPYAGAINAADDTNYSLDMRGACMNIGAVGTNFARNQGDNWAATVTHSTFFAATAVGGVYKMPTTAGINCVGAITYHNNADAGGNPSDFGFEGLNNSGDSDCGGSIALNTKQASGIAFTTAAAAPGMGITATIFKAKQHIAMDIVGPFGAATCTTFSGTAGKNALMPLVIPLEEAVATNAPDTEKALAVGTYQCTSFNQDPAVNNGYIWKASMASATTGEFTLQYTRGTATIMTNRNECTMSSVGAQNWVLKFKVNIRGNMENCVRATQEDGTTNQNHWYKILPSWESVGAFPSQIPYPSTGTTTASPAAGLHLSTFFVAFLAVIAMIM